MKNILLKGVCLTLSAAMLLSTAACGNNGGNNTPAANADITIKEYGDFDGLHIYNKTEIADKWLVKDGKTEYTLVIPDNSNARVTSDTSNARVALARSDFKDLFLQATGTSILSAKEENVTYTEDGKYIFIGCKQAEKTAGLELDSNLPAGKKINLEGFRIRTVGNSIFVSAQNEKGALWGTYELLAQLFDYERYWVDYYEINTGVKNLPLYDFDVADNPDFETRIGPWGSVYTSSVSANANRMRFDLQHSDVYVGETRFHNTLEYLPPETYMAEYPEWYAQQSAEPKALTNVFQLCYTAHGDAAKYQKMVDTMAEACEYQLQRDADKGTYYPILTITQEDNTRYCTCAACEAGNSKYGGNISGNMWKFQLDVVRKVNAWLDENIPGRKDSLLICMFAYQTYQQAPAYADANGVWHPYGEELDATKDPTVANAAIFYAVSTADYVRGLHRDQYNLKVHTAFDGWSVLTNNLGVWLYQTDFHDYMIPTDTFNYQQNYKLALDYGAKWIFDQGQQGNQNSSGFNDYKLYLNSKLQWNVNQNVNELEKKYFDAMYGPASDIMMEYYSAIRAHMQTIPPRDIDGSLSSAANFPYRVVKSWLNYVDAAYSAIEGLKDTDPAYYQACYDHICAESITARYLLIVYHQSTISPEQLVKEKASFKEDVLRLNFTEYIQHKDINDLVKDW